MTNNEIAQNPEPKLITAIIDRSESKRLENILQEKHAHLHFMFHAVGTASSEILNAFGLSATDKIVCACIEPAYKIKPIMTAVTERMELTSPGKGIVFVIPVSGISGSISNALFKELEADRERGLNHMKQETLRTNQEAGYELVAAVVNQGYSEDVMDAAKTAGAKGGTIIHARRSGLEEARKFFGISLQEEKEIIAILTHKNHKLELMQAINKACGMKTEAGGILISFPVESCEGIDLGE